MEPLNLMVSLSHFANTKPENKHGLSERAGRRGREDHERRAPRTAHGWWRIWLRGVVAR